MRNKLPALAIPRRSGQKVQPQSTNTCNESLGGLGFRVVLNALHAQDLKTQDRKMPKKAPKSESVESHVFATYSPP